MLPPDSHEQLELKTEAQISGAIPDQNGAVLASAQRGPENMQFA